MIAVTIIDAYGKQTEFDGHDADIDVIKSNPDYISLHFTTPKGEKVLVSFARIILIDPELRDEIHEASQHTNLFNASATGNEAQD